MAPETTLLSISLKPLVHVTLMTLMISLIVQEEEASAETATEEEAGLVVVVMALLVENVRTWALQELTLLMTGVQNVSSQPLTRIPEMIEEREEEVVGLKTEEVGLEREEKEEVGLKREEMRAHLVLIQ
jgi:hypothetical protein